MELKEPSLTSSKHEGLCKLCNENKSKYICPKCNIAYCSIECYKSSAHLECSENFYKQCVEEELKAQHNNSELKKRTLDMLQRIYNQEVHEDFLSEIMQEDEEGSLDLVGEEELDSDDENVLSLEDRIKHLDLEDANELWSALTAEERQKFTALVQNGDALNLLPSWTPWWTFTAEKKLVKDVNDSGQDESYKNNCPQILCIPTLDSKSIVSPLVRFSIINVVYSYAYSVMHLNGEHHSTPLNSVHIILRLSETLRTNRVFKDATSAVESVLLEITNCDTFSADQETILETKKAGDAILHGPEEENKCYYILSALSDVHQLLLEAIKEISVQKLKSSNDEFSIKFESNIDLGSMDVSRKSLKLLLKKIEFFIANLKLKSLNYDITEGENV